MTTEERKKLNAENSIKDISNMNRWNGIPQYEKHSNFNFYAFMFILLVMAIFTVAVFTGYIPKVY